MTRLSHSCTHTHSAPDNYFFCLQAQCLQELKFDLSLHGFVLTQYSCTQAVTIICNTVSTMIVKYNHVNDDTHIIHCTFSRE